MYGITPCCTGFQVKQHMTSTCLKTWSESRELPFNESFSKGRFWHASTSNITSLLQVFSAPVNCGMTQHGARLQVATAAFKTLMALLGDTHQYEALLGCRSSLPTGQSLRAFWKVSEACDTDAGPHASAVQHHWQAIYQSCHADIGVIWQRILQAAQGNVSS